MIRKIISGGQSGADLAGLDVGLALGLRTGGFMTRGFMTEDGPRPEYGEKYGLHTVLSSNYSVRTRKNVEDADVTMIFSGFTTLQGGSRLTYRVCQESRKPLMVLLLPTTQWNQRLHEAVLTFLRGHTVLNVAGSRESQAPGTYETTYAILHLCLTHLRKWPE